MRKQEEAQMRKEPTSFEIELIDAPFTKVSDVMDKARVRIFYKGRNRNGGYITDSFAERLVSTLPYTPIKGIIDSESGDFLSHGGKPSEGKIYGIVPEDPQITWEEHKDEDGFVRTYLAADVLLFTGLYESAKHIIGKAQSMELLPTSIKGDWVETNDDFFFVYKDASFLGLQVLGTDVEPAFEGAAFYSLNADQLGGLLKKAQFEGGEILKDIKKPEVEVQAEVEEQPEAEYDYQAKISELEKEVATLKENNETLTENNKELTNEVEGLREFKLGIERAEKEEVLAQFAEALGEDIIKEFRDDLDTYDKVNLEKELVFKQYLLEKEASTDHSLKFAPLGEEKQEEEKKEVPEVEEVEEEVVVKEQAEEKVVQEEEEEQPRKFFAYEIQQETERDKWDILKQYE